MYGIYEISGDGSDSDFHSAGAEGLPSTDQEEDKDKLELQHLSMPSSDSLQLNMPQRSNSQERSLMGPISSAPSMRVVCDNVPVCDNVDYPSIWGTRASQPQANASLLNPNYSRTSGPSSTSLSWNLLSEHYSPPRPNQIKMCAVCHVRPQCQRGGKIYPTCGLSCAAKMHAPVSIGMCDYCKKRPKVVLNGKTYPQCGKTCRDKAKLAETAANAAACTSCILCWKSTKAEKSDFCSPACKSLADDRAPFLIEIPRGHVAFKQVAEFFTSGWKISNIHCPTVKRIYMVVMKSSFQTHFEKYRTKIGSQNTSFQRKPIEKKRWLVVSRECGFGDPGDLEPCSSKKCLLCCIVRSSFTRLDFPEGITTSALNRTVQRYRSSKKSSSKIAALVDVLVGREAEMTLHDMQVVRGIPPPHTHSVHAFGVHRDGSRFDTGDIIVYDGDAVKPLYLISYE